MTDNYKPYLCEYPFDGGIWSVTIKATSREEAEARIRSMPWATVKGEVFATVPVPGGRPIARFIAWLKS